MRKGVTYFSVGLLITTAINYILNSILTRTLSLSEYGDYGLIWNSVVIVATCIGMSISTGLVSYLAQSETLKLPVIDLFLQCLKIESILIILCVGVSLVLADFLRYLFSSNFLYWIFIITVSLFSFSFFLRALPWGMRSLKFYISIYVAEALTRLLFFIAFRERLGDFTAAIYSIGFSSMIGITMSGVYILMNKKRFKRDERHIAASKNKIPIAFLLPMILFSGVRFFVFSSGPIFVKALGGQKDIVGIFTAALLLTKVPQYLFEALSTNLLPNLARIESTGASRSFHQLLVKSLLFAGGSLVLIITGFGLFGPLAMRLLWGQAFVVNPVEIMLLALCTNAWVIVDLIDQAILAKGQSVYLSLIWVIGAILLTGLMAWLPFGWITRFSIASISASTMTGILVLTYYLFLTRNAKSV